LSRHSILAVALVLVGAAVAGCVSQTPADVKQASASLPDLTKPVFAATKLLDTVRAGGEPVIAITPKGTILVGAHPGWTHTRYPPSPNLVEPATGQSYMWRSTDNGTTFAPVGLPGANGVGPRGIGQGVSDPDFAIDKNGRIYFTDLEGLASASVSWSDDDGQTWLMGNDVAASFGGGPIDRNWLAAQGTDVYFEGNYFQNGEQILKSTDGGITWSVVGQPPCEQQFVVPQPKTILVGCPTGMAVSTDDGAHFEPRLVPGAKAESRGMSLPALDAAGNVYVTWAAADGIYVAGTRDLGKTWSHPINLAKAGGLTGTNVWPWVVAGDAGRVAVLWYGTNATGGPANATGDWFVYEATVLDAMNDTAQVSATQVTPKPIFQGHICQNGTTCQADPSPAGDRRLGDFFEAAVDAQGYVHVVYAVALGDSISHPGYSKQTGGIPLKAPSSANG